MEATWEHIPHLDGTTAANYKSKTAPPQPMGFERGTTLPTNPLAPHRHPLGARVNPSIDMAGHS